MSHEITDSDLPSATFIALAFFKGTWTWSWTWVLQSSSWFSKWQNCLSVVSSLQTEVDIKWWCLFGLRRAMFYWTCDPKTSTWAPTSLHIVKFGFLKALFVYKVMIDTSFKLRTTALMEHKLYKEEVDITGCRALIFLLPPYDEPNFQSTAVIGQ